MVPLHDLQVVVLCAVDVHKTTSLCFEYCILNWGLSHMKKCGGMNEEHA